MADYKHGVYGSEEATPMTSMQNVTDGITISIGVSPVHLAVNPAEANKPVLCYQKNEAVQQLGYSEDFKTYTNCESTKLLFDVFGVSPVIFVNVFDPKRHKSDVTKEITLANGVATLAAPILLDTLKITGKKKEIIEVEDFDDEGEEIDDDLDTGSDTSVSPSTPTSRITTETRLIDVPLINNEDYTTETDDDGNVIVTITSLEKISDNKAIFSYSQPDPSKVTKEDIIGKVDPVTGRCSGIKLTSEVYARYGILSGILIAPGWSEDPEVAAALASEAENMDEVFLAVAPVDLDTTQIEGYTGAPAWKNQNGYSSKFQVSCYPMVKLGDRLYHGSTYLAGLLNRLDSQNDGIPFNSPSNKAISISGMYNADGTENYFGRKAANYLNGNGIVTFLNFNGWKMWGNRTSNYPQSSDPKDNFVSVRRMFNYVNNRLIINFWSQIDEPTNRRLIDDVINKANTWFNGLVSRGALLGGRCEFLESDNTQTDLMDGKIRFRVSYTPVSPAREIHFISQYDPDYLSNLFVS